MTIKFVAKKLPGVDEFAEHGVGPCALLFTKSSIHAQLGVSHAHVNLGFKLSQLTQFVKMDWFMKINTI